MNKLIIKTNAISGAIKIKSSKKIKKAFKIFKRKKWKKELSESILTQYILFHIKNIENIEKISKFEVKKGIPYLKVAYLIKKDILEKTIKMAIKDIKNSKTIY